MPPMQHDAHISLDMSISEGEFARLIGSLPRKPESLAEEPPASEGCRAWRLRLAAGEARITFHPLPPRRIGALRLPRARVELHVRALPPRARAAFLHRFRRHFQRGGG